MKKVFRQIRLIAAIAPILSLVLTTGVAHAAGSATYSLVQNGNSVSIYEDSGSQPVNTVDAELTYGGSQPINVSTAGSPFTSCTSSSATSVVCFIPDTSVSSSQFVASLTFADGSSTQVSLTQGSYIVSPTSSTTSVDIWDHAAVSGNYSFAAAPAPAPAPAPVVKSSHPTTTGSTTPTSTTTAVQGTAVKKSTPTVSKPKTVTVASAATKKTSYTLDYVLLLVLIVIAVGFESRRRMMLAKETAAANSYKLASKKRTSKKAQTAKSSKK